MRRLVTAVFIATFSFAPPVSSKELTVNDVLDNSGESQFFQAVVYSTWQGLQWMHIWTETRDGVRNYCQPEKLGMGLDTVRGMVKSYIEDNPADGERASKELGLVMIMAARDTFPCN
ncbi:hypothetical protein [Rhizobium rhizophilum]|uniref:Rap1a immunity protein domain-containing protein n=1 Tax=Rhizobium rhizophilum TaxID=1850373 RepID=A0ABY2R1I2_9HYPH|nr:hypothetical protein [Rhizobium rhizophilum]THV16711.1 hypothetical protein E9677_01520 [Rhizobium rhizophilum]